MLRLVVTFLSLVLAERPIRQLWLASLGAVIGTFLGAGAADAGRFGAYQPEFDIRYPAVTPALGQCVVCHTTDTVFDGNNPRTLYGAAVEAQLGLGIDAALAAVEPADSDGDGWTNLQELAKLTFPGNVASFPLPSITSVSPNLVRAGSGGFVLRVFGQNFRNVPLKSTVLWNDADRATTFVSETELLADILASDILSPGTGIVRVRNAEPGGGTSNALDFPLTGVATAFDFDGDGKAELAVYRTTTAEWFTLDLASLRGQEVTLGSPGLGDRPVAADYDGDGKTDFAVYRTTTAQWFVFGSSTGFTGAVTLGSPGFGDVPVPADYDGDGKADLAVFRPSTAQWFVFGSATGFTGAVTLGSPGFGDVPVPADYDGDGKADLAVFRPSTAQWFIFGSATGFTGAVTLGALGDLPVSADYDGDGKADLAVFRPSTAQWFIFGSATGFTGAVTLGSPGFGDVPVPADYDGDSNTDFAVYRTATAQWFVFGSSTGFNGAVILGGPGLGDIPIPGR